MSKWHLGELSSVLKGLIGVCSMTETIWWSAEVWGGDDIMFMNEFTHY